MLYWRFFVTKNQGGAATALLLSGLLAHSFMLVVYTIQQGYLPLGQFASAATTFVWLFGLLYFIQELLLKEQEFGVFVTAILAVVQGISIVTIDYTAPLAEVLQNVYFEVHVSVILLSYASFALGFIASIMYIMLFKEIQGHRFGLFYSRLPSLEFLERLNMRSIIIGLIFLTAGIVLGMLNAGRAWGFFWEWDPKLTMVFLNWLIYLSLVLAYAFLRLRGLRTAYWSLVGFLLIIFSFFIVTNFVSTIHTF
ncbi:MAG: hypothetical protein GWN14_22240 [candidate division Zixibacteria bacterium]|nr:hypothetical protein [Gammaproteobacteria bacterium]NIX58564.1 hypothetical protein [candidate division Zixibacteria bacterium]